MKRTGFLLPLLMTLTILTEAYSSLSPAAASGLDLRLFPIIPAIRGAVAGRAYQLAYRGRRYGNRLDVFSKIGDSITAWDYSLTPIGAGGLRLGNFGNLQRTVSFFTRDANSFAAISFAAHDAWTSYDLLNPALAKQGACAKGETPVQCELRASRPGVALIMIGTNDLEYNNPAAFRANLDQIVTLVEHQGVIPVLSTIPHRRDKPGLDGRVYDYNVAIVQVALAHAAPLWNYWLAVEGLPANGVSIDGVHPSLPGDHNTAIFDAEHLQAGWTMRNLTALQVLDALMPVLQ